MKHSIRLKRREVTCVALLAPMLLLFSARAWSQDSAQPDLKQMQQKLEQLDQEMQQLKAQIRTAEEAKKSAEANAPPTGAAPSATETVAKEGEETLPKSRVDFY